MRKLLLGVLLLAGLLVACDTKAPTGPSTVTIITPNTSTTTSTSSTTTTSTTTTTTTTTVGTTTTIPLINLNRTWVAFGPVIIPSQPVQLTLLLQPLGVGASGAASTSWTSAIKSVVNRLPFFRTQADPVFTAQGTYRSLNGGGGRVRGDLLGTFDNGLFSGTLTYETAECTAEREFVGNLDEQFLRLTGGRTFRDCKDSPLNFGPITMLVSQAPLPTTTTPTSSTTSQPLTCSYALSAPSAEVGSAGGERTVGLITGPTCSWSVQNFVEWIKVQPVSGIGSTTVLLTVAANSGPPRTATLVIGGQPFIVNQNVTTTTTTTSTTTMPTTSMPAMPDLLPIPIDGSFCRATDATNTTLRVVIRNGGNDAVAGPFFTRVTFDSGSTITSEDRLIPSLGPNANQEVGFTIPAACRVSPACNIQILTDANSGVTESNEGNNIVGASCKFSP